MSKHGLAGCCLAAAFGLGVMLGAPGAPRAQTAGLDQLSDWYYQELLWRSTRGLPVDVEFTAPLAAHYNWAYGATVLGVNARGVGGSDYYATLAVLDQGSLDAMDVVGPISGPAEWACGPYHLAAGLPDGRIIVWLTAPREYPHRVTFTDSYQPATALDFVVYTTDPVDANWEAWWVTGAYQYAGGAPSLLVVNQDGNGKPIDYFQALPLPGDLASVQYMDYPVGAYSIAYLLYTVVRDRQFTLGNNQHLSTYAAWFEAPDGWYTQTVRNSGLYNGTAYLGFGEERPFGMLACDESDQYGVTSLVQLLGTSTPDNVQVQTTLSSVGYIPGAPTPWAFSFLPTTRSRYPFLVFTDGLNIQFGYYVEPQGRLGTELTYSLFNLFQGEVMERDGQDVPAYPISAVAVASHWSAGDPEVFWVQQGSRNHEGGQLFHLGFEPLRR